MKKIFILVLTAIISFNYASAQYFQGSFSLGTNDTLIFKIKPTASITTAISYIEAAFRYKTSSFATPLTTSNPVSNTTNFPGLNIVSFPPDYTEGDFTYIKFIYNTGTISSNTYNPTQEYELFKVKLLQSPSSANQIEMASDLVSQNFLFAILDGGGNLIDPGTNPQFYGSGFYTDGDKNLLPLLSSLSVNGINLTTRKINNDVSVRWQVINKSKLTTFYEVERSLNGSNFTKINITPASSDENLTDSYEFTDKNIIALKNSGNIFYRIKQLDKNNKFKYSDVRFINLSGNVSASIFPNPATTSSSLNFELTSAQKVSVTVRDINGKVISRFQQDAAKGFNQAKINVNNLAKGKYNVTITDSENNIQTLPLIKL